MNEFLEVIGFLTVMFLVGAFLVFAMESVRPRFRGTLSEALKTPVRVLVYVLLAVVLPFLAGVGVGLLLLGRW